MNLEIPGLDAKAVNDAITKALVESLIGDQVVAATQKFAKELLLDSWQSPLKAFVGERMKSILKTDFDSGKFDEVIRKAFQSYITEHALESIVREGIKSFKNEMENDRE